MMNIGSYFLWAIDCSVNQQVYISRQDRGRSERIKKEEVETYDVLSVFPNWDPVSMLRHPAPPPNPYPLGPNFLP